MEPQDLGEVEFDLDESEPAGEPDLDHILQRVISAGFFPGSPAAVTREAFFSDILAAILGAHPKTKEIDDLRGALYQLLPSESKSHLDELWDAFEAAYLSSGEVGSRGKKAQGYLIPFHPEIACRIKPKESRRWGPWFQLLMTKQVGATLEFNTPLHTKLVRRLQGLEASNTVEQLFVEAAMLLERHEGAPLGSTPIRPYISEVSERFQSDLRTLLLFDHDASAQWLQSAADLLCFYMMMVLSQTAINLRLDEEASAADYDRSPAIIPLAFGMWDEKAGRDREFSSAWAPVERDLYDSWGRLSGLRRVSEVCSGRAPFPVVRLPELKGLDSGLKNEVKVALDRDRDTLCRENEEPRRDSASLGEAASGLAQLITRYYQTKTRANQTPITLGINVVRQFGGSGERRFLRSQRQVGVTFRLNPESVRLFARLFACSGESLGFDQFVRFLEQRGVRLDEESRRSMMNQLQSMGMLERQSDSGDAVYVRVV